MGNTRSERKCSVSGCSEKHHAKGYCKIHKELKAAGNLAYRAGRYGAKSDKIKREDVFEACKWICQICGKSVDKEIKYPNPLSASIDHMVPLSKSGTHTKDNVQLVHFLCNSRKGARVS